MPSQLDGEQILQALYNDADNSIGTSIVSGLVPEAYDEMTLTYVTAGNGIGEISTVTYKKATVVVATITLGYDGSNRLNSIVKS